MKINERLAKLLPKGLDTDVVNEITKLLTETMNEAVEAVRKEENAKVFSFIRANIDKLKEQAVSELELEDERFHKVQLLETVTNILIPEITDEDYERSMTVAHETTQETEKQLEFVTGELGKALKEINKLEATNKALVERKEKMEKKASTKLQESKNLLELLAAQKELKEQDVSGEAVVRSDELEKQKGEKTHLSVDNGNPLLTEEVMKHFPQE